MKRKSAASHVEPRRPLVESVPVVRIASGSDRINRLRVVRRPGSATPMRGKSWTCRKGLLKRQGLRHLDKKNRRGGKSETYRASEWQSQSRNRAAGCPA